MPRFFAVVLLVASIGVHLSTAQGEWFEGFSDFKNGVTDASENHTSYIYCYTYTREPVTWTLTTNTNTTLLLGTCGEWEDWCSTPYPDIEMYSGWFVASEIAFWNIQRDTGGRLTCSVTYDNNTTKSDDVLLNVYQPPSFDNCHVHTVRSNWSAVLSCDVSHVFSTADLYTFHVLETYLSETDTESRPTYRCRSMASDAMYNEATVNHWEVKFTETKDASSKSGKCIYHGPQSYHPNLISYVNSTNNKEYYRGRLVYSWRLSSFPADNLTVKIYVCAGSRSWTCRYFENYLSNLAIPSPPRHNCTDVTYIPEAGGTRCMCTIDDLGSPAGRLLWMMGNATMATGEYDIGQLLLTLDSVTRDKDGHQIVCELDWIKPQHVGFALNVAYGPDHVDLHISQQYDANNKVLIFIECQVTGLNPKSPDMVQWEGPCQDQRGFTCILDPQEEEVQGKTVKCQVTNAANNKHSAGATKVIETEKAADSGGDQLKWAAIGAAAILAAEVVITVLLVVVICTWRQGHLCKGPHHDSTKAEARQQANSSATDTHLYEVLASNRNRGRNLPAVPRTDPVYENAVFDEQEGHM